MKEATGEANMTIITVALIAIVLFLGTLLVKNMMDNTKKRTECQSNGGTWEKGECVYTEVTE